MKAKELREMTDVELNKQLKDLNWTPLPRRRKVVPLWVPSGTLTSTLPSMEGTVMLSPRPPGCR